MRTPPHQLVEIVAFILVRAGVDPEIAREVAEALVEADLTGHASHGVRLLDLYVRRLQNGEVSGSARPTVSRDAGPVIVVDGCLAFGQVAGAFGARLGAEAAKAFGVAAVAVLGSGHFGRNGKWAEIAADRGIASIHFINAPLSPARLVIPGTREPCLTSNPISLGAPHPAGDHIILDFSTGAVSVNAIRRTAERGTRLPERCIIDSDGGLTDDPRAFLDSHSPAMIAFGGYKGFALGVFAEIFAGAISAGACLGQGAPGAPVNNMLSLYVDPRRFQPDDRYDAALLGLIARLQHGSLGEHGCVPGARSRWLRKRHAEHGIEVDRTIREILAAAAARVNARGSMSQLWPDLFVDGEEERQHTD